MVTRHSISAMFWSSMSWAMAPLSETEQREIWEICGDRYQARSTISLPSCRSRVGTDRSAAGPTIADGILDRLVHHTLTASRWRRVYAQETQSAIRRAPRMNRTRQPQLLSQTGLLEFLEVPATIRSDESRERYAGD